MARLPEWITNLDAIYCLVADRKRTLAYKKAIEQAVKKNDIVAELGAGSAILSMFAAKTGAKKVYAVEVDKIACKLALKLIRDNKLEDKITVLNQNVLKLRLPQEVDLIIAELISGGLIDEIEVPAVNKALDYLRPEGKVIPSEIVCSVALVNYDFNLYDLNFKIPIHRWNYNRLINKERVPKFLSEPEVYLRVNLKKKNKLEVNKILSFSIEKSGIINGVNIQTNTRLFKDIWCSDTTWYAGDIVFPIPSRKVRRGENVSLSISYLMGGGFEKVKFNLTK